MFAKVCMQGTWKTTWNHIVVGFAEHYCGGRRPFSFAVFFLALQVSLASVLHSSESAKRHRSTESRGSGFGRADALKYIGWDVGDNASLSPEGRRVSDIGSSPSALQTARGEGVTKGGGGCTQYRSHNRVWRWEFICFLIV